MPLPPVKKDVKFSKAKQSRSDYHNHRIAVSRNLPLSFEGATPLRPDPGHSPSNVGGAAKRFAYQPPKMNRKTRRDFARFVKMWLRRKNITPLTDVEVPTFEEWLAEAPYDSARKEELTKVWNDVGQVPNLEKFHQVKSFPKDETYDEPKYPRMINSRVDVAKCYFGPVVQAVSDLLFARPEFIKTVPVAMRPLFIQKLLESSGIDQDYVFTDYTAFEAHFIKEVMDVTQFLLFEHCLKSCSKGREWLDVYSSTMTGRNQLFFKNFSMSIDAVRMSGEMDTSLSNGFANLMLFEYVVFKNRGTSVGVVEGDDGLFRVTPASATPTTEQFADLGFTIKIGITKNLSEASFCGQVYDMQDLVVVSNPLKVIARVGWTNRKYVGSSRKTLMMLLRAKGYSLVYQYARCPMLDALGRRILHLTAGVTITQRILDNMDQWDRQKLLEAMNNVPERQPVLINTRDLVARLYDVSISEQEDFEKKCETMELGRHKMPCLPKCPDVWAWYYRNYSSLCYTTDPVWLLKDESGYLKKLSSIPNLRRFVNSLV